MLNKKKINYKKNIFSYTTKLSKVVASINFLKIKLLLITKNNKLVGTLSDGDIRRFFLSNVSHDIKIENIMNKKPKFIFENSNIQKFKFPNTVRFLPVLNKNKKIKGLLDLNNIKPVEYPNSVLIMAGGRGERLGKTCRNSFDEFGLWATRCTDLPPVCIHMHPHQYGPIRLI